MSQQARTLGRSPSCTLCSHEAAQGAPRAMGATENVTFDMQKDLGSERLKYLYNKYTEDDDMFDPYEASMIIGTAVHYAWKTYAGKLEKTAVIYIFDSAHENETGGAIFLGESNDKYCYRDHEAKYCYPEYGETFSFKDTVNEWTVTKWALHGTTEIALCKKGYGLAKYWA